MVDKSVLNDSKAAEPRSVCYVFTSKALARKGEVFVWFSKLSRLEETDG
jgi:hypothetical protein